MTTRMQNDAPATRADDAARAAELEQQYAHGGERGAIDQGADPAAPGDTDPVGSSGHVPQLDEIRPSALHDHTGSTGADADRRAAEEGR